MKPNPGVLACTGSARANDRNQPFTVQAHEGNSHAARGAAAINEGKVDNLVGRIKHFLDDRRGADLRCHPANDCRGRQAESAGDQSHRRAHRMPP